MHWWRRKKRERDLERELLADLDLEAAELVENGLSAEEARYAARRAFGNLTLIKEDTRAMWRWTWVERFYEDLRYALRTARREPGFAAVVVLTLALGIGINTAVFSVTNTVLFRKPQLADPDRLVTLQQKFPKLGDIPLGTAPAEYLDYRDRSRAFSSIVGYEDAVFDLTGGMEPVHVQALSATHTLFSTLGVRPLRGRTFSPAEDQPGGAKVAVLSYELWQSRFGGSPQTLGSIIRLNEQPYMVIGIMPASFEFPFTAASVGEPPALWVPVAFTAKRIQDRAAEFPVHIVARLKPGVSLPQAEQDVRRVADEFQREHADIYSGNVRLQVNLDPLGARDAARVRPVLLALMGAVGFVLLIACANVTNLLLARAAKRQREMAVRNALGASAKRLVAQLLTEGLLLTAVGAALGCALAQAIIELVASLWPSFVAGLAQVRIDPTVVVFTLGISILTGLVCSLVPAMSWTRPDTGATLKLAGRQGASQVRQRLRGALVVLEASSAVILLIGAGLLIHSLIEVLRVPMGFSPDGVLMARTTFNRQRYPTADRRHDSERQMVERLAALPGVAAVGLTTHIPLADDRQIGFVPEGDENSVRWADNALVSDNYFTAMGIPIVRGRTFTSQDTHQSPGSAIVNESMARRFWPNGDAIGKRIIWGGRKLTVVGIAGDVHIKALDSGVNPTIYCSVYQVESGATTSAVFVVRTRTSDPTSIASAVRQAISSVDPGVPIFDVRTMDQIVSRSLTSRRFVVALLSSFAIVALALAVIGLYGVLSYAVAQRTSELGVRFALGATPAKVLRLVLADGLRLTSIGVVIGALLGVVAARAMSRLLFGIRVFDLTTFAIAVAMLIAVALVASYVPAKRAAGVDPMVALRHE
jgi:putative ABC transport system permease protein